MFKIVLIELFCGHRKSQSPGKKMSFTTHHFFLELDQVYTNRSASSLKANVNATYPVHFVLPEVSKYFFRTIIAYGYTLDALLPLVTSNTGTDAEVTGSALKQ